MIHKDLTIHGQMVVNVVRMTMAKILMPMFVMSRILSMVVVL
jgi:hypothetical protein